jgi:mannose-6-phosphate isomerase-like protein (cupin superfamily)
LGIGVSLLLSTLNSYFRIVPSMRVFWRFMSNTDETKELFPYRIPTSAASPSKGPSSSSSTKEGEEAKEETAQNSSSSPTITVRTLVDPSMATTAHLHVQYISIPPHYEIPPKKSSAVEFYYVIAGTGVMSQQGIPVRQALTTGDCCVVDAHHMRWFKNTTASQSQQPLILLRATDGPCGPDRIRKDPNHRDNDSNTGSSSLDASAAVIASGLKTLQTTASDYYGSVYYSKNKNKSNNNNGINGKDKTLPLPARKKTVVVEEKARYGIGRRPQKTLTQ